MSRDIRSFFKIDKKRKNEEDESPNSKITSKHHKTGDDKHTVNKKKRRIIDSDDESDDKKASHKTKELKSEKPQNEVKNIKDLFGGPIKRKERPKEVSPKKQLNSSVVCVDDQEDEAAIIAEIEDKLQEPNKISPGKENRTTEEVTVIEKSSTNITNNKKDETKEIKDDKPKVVDDKPKIKDEKPKIADEKPKIKDDKHKIKDEKPKIKDEKPKIKDEKPKFKEETKRKSSEKIDPPKPVTSKSQPSSSKSSIESTVKASKSGDVTKQSPSKSAAKSVSQVLQPAAEPSYSFVDKYKPTNAKQIIGQQGPQSNANKLQNWLLHWHRNHGDPTKKKKANPFARDSDGSSFKAALLSGPPGIGKTTTAHLVCKELLFDVVEFNASDTRSKKLLKEEVSQLLTNKSLKGYLTGDEKAVSKRHVLIMDEVDGMAGNEDRGGVAELIALIKESQIPIICMCNDRSHPKMRSLVNYCFDLRFNKPSVNQIRSAMMSICFKEGIKLDPGAIDAIISGTGNDVRQTLNHLAIYSASKDKRIDSDKAKRNAQISEKDIKIGPWDVIRKVFSEDEHKTMTLNDKSDLFFYDYSIAPLFVQENYLRVKPNCKDSHVLKRIARTADSISIGDMVDKRIRSNMAWSLLPTQAMFSSVIPGELMEGSFKSAPSFPTWLGRNSKAQKRKRMAQEIHEHTRIATSGSRSSIRLDYAQFLVQAIIRPLKEKGVDGVKDALDVLKEYRLLREDIDSLMELTSWGSSKNPWDQIDSKTKGALTRAYNKEVQAYSYSAQAGVKKKRGGGGAEGDMYGEEDEEGVVESDNEDDDDLEKNSMIKVKKVNKQEPKAGTSKASKSTAPKAKSTKSKK